MTKAVLIVAHGSRAAEAKRLMEQIAQMVRQKLPDHLIGVAYMEFDDVTIERGLDALVAAGASHIRVAPYFLFDGMHIQKDIPDALQAYREAHPAVTIRFGGTLGADERLADILCERITEI